MSTNYYSVDNVLHRGRLQQQYLMDQQLRTQLAAAIANRQKQRQKATGKTSKTNAMPPPAKTPEYLSTSSESDIERPIQYLGHTFTVPKDVELDSPNFDPVRDVKHHMILGWFHARDNRVPYAQEHNSLKDSAELDKESIRNYRRTYGDRLSHGLELLGDPVKIGVHDTPLQHAFEKLKVKAATRELRIATLEQENAALRAEIIRLQQANRQPPATNQPAPVQDELMPEMSSDDFDKAADMFRDFLSNAGRYSPGPDGLFYYHSPTTFHYCASTERAEQLLLTAQVHGEDMSLWTLVL